ncbi:MAG: RNA methyltransferase [Ignavibacteriae bacterium]|nr:RNA methyltransferase [Ignavibacteriota bacterium]
MRKLTHDEIAQQRLAKERMHEIERLPIYGMLDNIRSLYNVGSMFRTSDGALVKKLFLCGYTPFPPRKEIDKTALGSTETVPWEYHRTHEECIAAIKNEGAKVCVLEHTTKSIPYFEVKKSDFPICLVVGNEISGISAEVIAAADCAIEIPMFGMKQSLNAAVAYGIALFELVRVWRSDID